MALMTSTSSRCGTMKKSSRSGEFLSDPIGENTVREELNDDRGVQNNHRASRSSRMTWAAVRVDEMRLTSCVRSSHSCTVGGSCPPAPLGPSRCHAPHPGHSAPVSSLPCARNDSMRCTCSQPILHSAPQPPSWAPAEFEQRHRSESPTTPATRRHRVNPGRRRDSGSDGSPGTRTSTS
jgi:hypothetical protein